MAHLFPSDDWAAAYKRAINENPKYRAAGKDWTHGAVAFVARADPSLGMLEDLGVWLDVHEGRCRDCRLVTGIEASEAPFVIVAEYADWKTLILKELESDRGHTRGETHADEGAPPDDREVRGLVA